MTISQEPKKKTRGLSKKWKRIIDKIMETIQEFGDVKPSLRTIFYRLESLGLIEKTENAYNYLSKKVVEARKEGKIEWDALSDEGRMILGDVQQYITPDSFVLKRIDHLRSAHEDYRFPRWHEQPHYVEVWIEKLALAGTFQSILKDKEVYIAINRGFSSWTFFYQNSLRLERTIIERGGEFAQMIHVLYYGDMDPSGDMIRDHLMEMLEYFRLEEIDFKIVAVTEDQIREYNLPAKPAKKSKKIKKGGIDKIAEKCKAKHGGSDKTVELDSFLAKERTAFEKLVVESVDDWFDPDIYKRVQSELPKERKSILRPQSSTKR